MESARIWLLADKHQDAIAAVHDLLAQRGAQVEILDLSLAMEKVLRDRGERLLGNLKGILARVRRAEAEPNDEQPLHELLERGRPDLLVAASPRFLPSLDLLARAVGGDPLRVALLPDYNLGNAWLKGAAQAYVLPHEDLKAPLLEAGIDPRRLFIAGPAVPAAYHHAPDAAALRAQFGLDQAQGAVLLALCDGADPADLDRLVFQISLVDKPLTPIFYAGADDAAAEALRRAAHTHGVLANLLRAVPNLHDFLAVADLVLARPDDERLLGALALDRPLLLVGSPGPVTTQADFLAARGVALRCDDVLRLGAEIELALRPGRLDQMSQASRAVGRTTGAAEVADALALILTQRAELAPAPAAPQNPPEPQTAGPFERIGVARQDRPAPPRPAGPFEPVGADAPRQKPAAAPPQPVSPISADAAKDELAALIMVERDLERRLSTHRRDQEQWHNRLELAREWNEGELAREAEARLRQVLDEAERMQAELDKVRVQKEKLKERVRAGRPPESSTPAPPPTESRFRDMEVESDLNALRRRLREEMGE
jgi:hypothetical protein